MIPEYCIVINTFYIVFLMIYLTSYVIHLYTHINFILQVIENSYLYEQNLVTNFATFNGAHYMN